MTRKRTPQSGVEPSLTADQAAQLLRAHIEKGMGLLDNRPITLGNEEAWETVCQDLLIRAYGSSSPNVNRVMDVGQFDNYFGGGEEEDWERSRASRMETRLEILEGLVEVLESQTRLVTTGSAAASAPPDGGSGEALGTNVFLVHGHEEAVIQATARFLEKLDLEVTILREQPNSGRTIIEKFVDHSDVGFAVVLLTGDDRGGVASKPDDLKPRARQNVILELGFFLGKLGRHRVCALYQSGVEIPSDYDGVLFVPLDEGGAWRMSLARELKAVGLPIDMNKAV